MIRFHIKSALKYILKFRNHTVFSLLGLAFGLACVFIISAWAIEELRYDRFHHRAGDIFMLTTDIKDSRGNVTRFPETPSPLAAALEEQIPQIECGFRFLYLYGGRSVGTDDVLFEEAGLAASPDFLDVFNFPLISGQAAELNNPNSIFLSKRLADKIFPRGMALGQEIQYKGDRTLIVNGIFKNVPRNSSLLFDFLIPYEIEYGISEDWWQLSDASFIKLSPSADREQVHSVMTALWREQITDEQFNIGMIPITELRYGADFEFFNAEHGHGSRKKLYLFMGVALLILILACLNYLNLMSAYAIKREHEIWIRKVHGASSGNISFYLMNESVLLSIVAWALASVLALLGLRIFENLMGIEITPFYFRICIASGLVIAILIVGLASGFYPAFSAGYRALVQNAGSTRPDLLNQRNLRNVFIMSQFILSIALCISSLIIIRQANFMKDFETGYAREDIVEFKLETKQDTLLSKLNNYLNTNPGVELYSFAGTSPVSLTFLNTMEKWEWEGLEEGAHTAFYRISADENFLDVFKIPLVAGRFFSSYGNDENRVVINEKLASVMNFQNPVGHILRRGETAYEIIGVVRDFHFQHLSNPIQAQVFTYSPSSRHLFVKIRSNAIESVSQIQQGISAVLDHPPDYTYVSEEYNQMYSGEQQIISAILIFTVLSILLSILGLIGVVTHGNEARLMEIAVRKVYGAESLEMMIALYMNILKIFIPGLVFGSLLSWLVMRHWLMEYESKRGFEAWVFAAGAGIILIVSLISVCVQTWKAANKSPIAVLKNL